jgi:hypothetical protein
MRSVRTEATDGRSSLYLSNVVAVVGTRRFAHRFNVIAIVTMTTCIVIYRRLYNVCECQSRTQCKECDDQTVIKSSQKVVSIYQRQYLSKHVIEPGA